MYSASPEALLKAKIGKLEYLTNYEKDMLFIQSSLFQKWFAGGTLQLESGRLDGKRSAAERD